MKDLGKLTNDEVAELWLISEEEMSKISFLAQPALISERKELLFEIEKRMSEEGYNRFLDSDDPQVLFDGLRTIEPTEADFMAIFSGLNP